MTHPPLPFAPYCSREVQGKGNFDRPSGSLGISPGLACLAAVVESMVAKMDRMRGNHTSREGLGNWDR